MHTIYDMKCKYPAYKKLGKLKYHQVRNVQKDYNFKIRMVLKLCKLLETRNQNPN